MLIKFNNVYFIPDKFKLLSNEENCYILSNISFCIKDKVSAIVGPSGSGKTTIGKMISGELAPVKGSVEVTPGNGKIGMVCQNSFEILNPYRTAGSQLLDIYRLESHKSDTDKKLDYLKSNLGIDSLMLEKKAGELSGGQRQRVSIARQLLYSPDLLVLDEPFSAQDEFYKDKLSGLLREFSETYEIQLVIISHELQYLTAISDTFFVIAEGELTDIGDFFELRNNSKNNITRKLLSGITQ